MASLTKLRAVHFIAGALFLMVLVVGISTDRERLLPGFAELEQAQARSRAAVIKTAFKEELNHLGHLAEVSVAYGQVKVIDQLATPNSSSESALQASFARWSKKLDVDFSLFLTRDGGTRFTYTRSDGHPSLPNNIELNAEFVEEITRVWRRSENRDRLISGGVATEQGAVMLAIAPLKSRDFNAGTILLGRSVNSHLAKQLSSFGEEGVSLNLSPLSKNSAGLQSMLKLRGERILEQSDDRIEISETLISSDDFEPLVLTLVMSRELMQQGERGTKLALGAVILACIALAALVIIVLGTYVAVLRSTQRRIKSVVKRRTDQLQSARIQAERALQEAERASEAKSAFLANMSHEVRTPINGIIGMAELAADFPLSAEQHNVVDTIMKEAEALRMLINNVLDLSKFEAGCLELANVDFGLVNCVEELFSAVALRASNKPIKFHCHIAPDVPVMAVGDPMRLRQVLMNLVGNAVKFTERGEINVEVQLLESLADQLYLKVSVRDTGIGMTADQQANIFEPFRQADVSITREYGGTGLGTSIALELIDMMDGELAVESEPGKGSCFWFTLHLGRSQKGGAVGAPVEPIPDHTILVAESDTGVRESIGCYLQSMGYQALLASNWEQMVQNYLCLSPADQAAAVVMASDHMLPSEIESRLPSLPVIVISDIGVQPESLAKQRWRDVLKGQLSVPLRWVELKKALSKLSVDEESERVEKPSAEMSQPLLGCKILLAEDYPANQKVAMAHLKAAGAEVFLAENGLEAVNLYQSDPPDLVLMDLQMPVMDGFTAATQIRAMSLADDDDQTPIVALSAHSLEGVREKCFELGMNDFLCKPFRRQALIATVQRWLSHGQPATQNTDETESDPKQGAVLNMERLMEEFLDDVDMVNTTLSQFANMLPEQLTQMKNALADGELETVRAEAHKIKGGAANLTADRLAVVAKVLEQESNAGNADKVAGALDELAVQIALLDQEIEEQSSKCPS
ncbi:ATP-binding protein [Corallincola platygyrae]|uniref:histidine kinase n=1 Tax=Corallincola platygyrae TaxID=1193278 RepID=A0ABW4XNG1_9GAMM